MLFFIVPLLIVDRLLLLLSLGTVCIGSFGLRGSMAVDNAAAAIETARTIVISLQSLGLTASIGITSGKVYCGIVGSQMRHEYAVRCFYFSHYLFAVIQNILAT